jgi:hypothetical protein
MKKIIVLSIFCIINVYSFAQMIMSVEGINPENVCTLGKIYFLIESKARPIESIDSIQARLNTNITFARENPTFTGKSVIQFAVNCKGEIGGGFHVVTKSGNTDFDNELISFFKTINNWKTGKIKKKSVDSWYMWQLEIKDGYIRILN